MSFYTQVQKYKQYFLAVFFFSLGTGFVWWFFFQTSLPEERIENERPLFVIGKIDEQKNQEMHAKTILVQGMLYEARQKKPFGSLQYFDGERYEELTFSQLIESSNEKLLMIQEYMKQYGIF